jgi:hypothetical protein
MSNENKVWLWIGIGCALPGLLGLLACCGFFVYFATGPEGGVRVGNTMEEYALEYVEQNQLIDPGENIHAYYDVTIALDSTECAILTDRRLIYHRNNRNTEMACEDIVFVESEDLGMMGDGITAEDVNGNVIYIEIAALNNSVVFLNALEKVVEENEVSD